MNLRHSRALGAAFYSSGIPKESVLAYKTAIKADGFLVTVHGPAEELAQAKAILDTLGASRVALQAPSNASGSAAQTA